MRRRMKRKGGGENIVTLPSHELGCWLTPGVKTPCVTGSSNDKRSTLTHRSHALSWMQAILDFMPLFGFPDVICPIGWPILLIF